MNLPSLHYIFRMKLGNPPQGISFLALFFSVILFMTVAISSCTSIGPVKAPRPEIIESEAEDAEYGWWYTRFKMKWPQDVEPSWHIDLLIAHQIVSPVLDQYRDRIKLWRFHRRASRDQNGHQFSFIFYSTAKTARQIYHSLQLFQ